MKISSEVTNQQKLVLHLSIFSLNSPINPSPYSTRKQQDSAHDHHSKHLIMKGEEKTYRFRRSKLLFLCTVFLLSNISSASHHRQLLSFNGDSLAVAPEFELLNPRLKNGYIALQAWKEAIISDPKNITANWVGEDVCNYTGVFCWPSPEYPHELTISGIDVNHGDMAGTLVHELGLLYDLALIHLNSNRFCGSIPQSFVNLKRLHELDLSNNRFAGPFPKVVLDLPALRYLDLRYNEFEGGLPRKLFENDLDAIFVNNNRFSSELPDNIGESRVSVIVLAHNEFAGCVPAGLGKMGETLNELVLTNAGLSSCFPSEIANLKNLTVLDLSFNKIVGPLPHSIGEMENLELLNLAQNMLSGRISDQICELPKLENFVYDNNFFSEESPSCQKARKFEGRMNCLRDKPNQRQALECQRFLSRPVDCNNFNCPTPPDSPPKVLPCSPPPEPTPSTPSEPPTEPPPAPAVTPLPPTDPQPPTQPPPVPPVPPPTNPPPLPPPPPPQPEPQPSPPPEISPSPTSPPIIPSPPPPSTPACPCQCQQPPQPTSPPIIPSPPPPSNTSTPTCPCQCQQPTQPSDPPSIS